jgi:hypothetical protein
MKFRLVHWQSVIPFDSILFYQDVFLRGERERSGYIAQLRKCSSLMQTMHSSLPLVDRFFFRGSKVERTLDLLPSLLNSTTLFQHEPWLRSVGLECLLPLHRNHSTVEMKDDTQLQ